MKNLHVSPAQAAKEVLARRKARKSLIDFTTYTMPRFEPSDHHAVICNALERVERGEVSRLMVFAPPRHTKSELSSRRFPTWYLGRNPTKQIIASTYNQDFASDFGRDVRGIISSTEYSRLFPDVRLKQDSKAADRMHTEQGGVYISVGVGGPITGRGAHIALIDDPIKNRQDADSETYRERVWQWYTSTLYTRLMPGGAIVLILTRWHEDDLAGRLLAAQANGGDQWEVIDLHPTESNGVVSEALWPQWYDCEALNRIKRNIGPRDWSALYMQQPQPDEGTFFMRDWFKITQPAERMNYYICGDFAVTEKDGDFTELGVFGVDADENIHIVDWWSGQETADVWIDALLDLVKQYKPLAFFGETGQIRRSIEPFLMKRAKERKLYTRIEWITRTGDKSAMARAFQARAAMGKVSISPRIHGDLLDQLLKFPAGKHDDKVDACALMGLALEEQHPAMRTAPTERVAERDAWGRIKQNGVGDNWKLL